jgi:thiosulfate dehydrogenase (quinone) large subunit
MKKHFSQKLMAGLRILLGWIFLWAFLDKTWGLGFATAADKSWLGGASPTAGFLEFGTKGPFAGLFQAMAGSPVVDWLFMMGLLLIGLALIFGVGMKIAAWSGSTMMLLMWLATLWPEHNPLVDEHLVYILALLLLRSQDAGDHYGFGLWWSKQKIVKKHPFLR